MIERGLWRCTDCSVVIAPDSRAPNDADVECPACGSSSWDHLGRSP